MQWKTRGRLMAAAILSAGFAAANFDPGGARAVARTLDVDQTDVAMNVAQSQAGANLDLFFRHGQAPGGASVLGAAVKVAFPTDDGGWEVIWVEPFEVRGDGFSGRLANGPNRLPGLLRGDQVHFARADIRDWSFWGEDGALYGNFTTRVLLPHMRPAYAARVASVLSESPIPEAWQDFRAANDFSLAGRSGSL